MNATTAILIVLQALQALLPSITSSKAVNSVLTALIQIVPLAIKEAQAVLPAIQNIIAALSANPAATAQQLATLQALDAQVDASFEDAVSAYLANHTASPAPSAG
jgi:hypothetical protein